MTLHTETLDLTIGSDTIGGCVLTRDAAGRVVAAAFWGAVALLAAQAEMDAAVRANVAVIDTVGEVCADG